MKLLDGKAASAQIRSEIAARTAAFESKYGKRPGLAVVLIGEDPASQIYVRNKIRACEETGIVSYSRVLPASCSQEEANALVKELVSDKDVNGILVQLPLPKGLDAEELLSLIPPEKDVDGFSAQNLGALAAGREGVVACTPLGVMELLKRNGVSVRGKHAVVIGRSEIVGRPMALLLLNADATVTVCHSRTVNLAEECRRADLLVAAVGKAGFVTEDMVKEGAVVVDVGTNRGADGKLRGDVDFDAVSKKASYITPVPGGVGPMTIAMLLSNTVDAAERQNA